MKLTPDELALLLLDDVSSFDEFFSFFYKEKKKTKLFHSKVWLNNDV